MSITVKLDLPEKVAQKAREAGLLDPARVAGLIQRELKAEEDQRSFFEIPRESAPNLANPWQWKKSMPRSTQSAQHAARC